MFVVKVIRQSTGKPVEGKNVYVSFSSIFRGGYERRSDKNGEAHFNADNGDGKILVNGHKVYEGYISGRVTVFI